MAIYTPGIRGKRGEAGGGGRDVVAVLSLTAMVDLFTVLVVFLLQNYATTGEVLEIPEGVKLPDAKEVKDLKPANVVIISDKGLLVNNDKVMELPAVKSQDDWELLPLKQKLAELIARGIEEKGQLKNQLKSAVEKIKVGDKAAAEEIDQFLKVTIQADKQMDFLTLKKIMYTVTEAGMVEINFAVMKKEGADATK
jgi:biopolymer transport protein ExbD